MKKAFIIIWWITIVCFLSVNIGCKKSRQTAEQKDSIKTQPAQSEEQDQGKESNKIWWEHRIGKEVVFVEMDKSALKQKYFNGYDLCRKPSLRCDGNFPYIKYVGKRGEIMGEVSAEDFSMHFWKIKLETGETVYAQRPIIFGEAGTNRDKIDYRNYQIKGMYFTEDYDEASKKVGKDIWFNSIKYLYLITDEGHGKYPLKHLEKLKIIGVVAKVFYPDKDVLYLKVQRETVSFPIR
jgi:hypothetical protein